MHELARLAYLEAMGVDSYVSRRALAAAPTRRLAVLRDRAVTPPAGDIPLTGAPSEGKQSAAASRSKREPTELIPASPGATETSAPRPGHEQSAALERFSLAAVVAGGILWLEDLAGLPIGREQVWLMDAMAQALAVSASRNRGEQAPAAPSHKPDVAQFDWPIHTNDQFDLGEEAAQASVIGFVSRRLEQFQCRGLVLLGKVCERRVQTQGLTVPVVRTLSTAQMLAEPTSKARVWRDLAPMLQH